MPVDAPPRGRRRRKADLEPQRWPSLGGAVCEWIEEMCVHGPGDVLAQPVKLSDEERLFIWRAYEIAPKGHPKEGRRRWSRVAYVRRKGVRKTELAGWITCAELLAPVRFDGWDADGDPVARPITAPYIPVASVGTGNLEDTLWGAIYSIVTEGPIVDEYSLDVGLERITEMATKGYMKPVSTSSIHRDGGKPTFTPRDETHLLFLPELVRLNDTLLRNLNKRPIAQPWALATTTAWSPGQGSVAEAEAEEARLQAAGLLPADTILWDERRASEKWDLDDDEQLRQALIEASGDALPWTDLDDKVREFRRGTRAESKRYWLGIPASVTSDESWLKEQPGAWEECRRPEVTFTAEGGPVAVGADSALRSDSVAVWALQEQPDGSVHGICRTWVAVAGRVYDRAALRNYLRWLVDLARHYGVAVKGIGYDPRYLESDAQQLEDEDLPMVEIPQQSNERMVPACRAGYELIVERRLRHAADAVSSEQVVAAVPRETDAGWRLSKGKSKAKIDSAVALCIAAYVLVHAQDEQGPKLRPGVWNMADFVEGGADTEEG